MDLEKLKEIKNKAIEEMLSIINFEEIINNDNAYFSCQDKQVFIQKIKEIKDSISYYKNIDNIEIDEKNPKNEKARWDFQRDKILFSYNYLNMNPSILYPIESNNNLFYVMIHELCHSKGCTEDRLYIINDKASEVSGIAYLNEGGATYFFTQIDKRNCYSVPDKMHLGRISNTDTWTSYFVERINNKYKYLNSKGK